MVAAVELRKDFDAAILRRLARRSKDSGQWRDAESIRDWVLRFNVHGPEGLIVIKAPGPKP